jgi:hypothetical protein
MIKRIFKVEKFKCLHCDGFVYAPSELLEDHEDVVSPVYVPHVCSKTERTSNVRFSVIETLEIKNPDDPPPVSEQVPRPRKKRVVKLDPHPGEPR